MAYTVKQVAAMSGVSVRTLHFYDETELLKPAYHGANGYRFYEEQQLLILQQILFYRELGFELKQIKQIVGRADFEKVAALESHREVLQENLNRARSLIETVDNTIQHLKGTKRIKGEEMFAGFNIAAGADRFGQRIELDGEPIDCKLSAKDTNGAVCIFEVTAGWPRHVHHDQDEWIYVIDGKLELEVGDKRFQAGTGESVFLPREVPHVWSPLGTGPSKIINVYRPAGQIEGFFSEVASFRDLPTRQQVIEKTYTDQQTNALRQLFEAYGMELLGPPLVVE